MNQSTTVTRQLVPEGERKTVVADLFGVHFPLRLEPVIYGITERMTQGKYRGGHWLFYTLNPGRSFYMAPDSDQLYQIYCDNWQGELSADALGITACLYAYSHLSFGGPEAFARICATHYHLLREYMMGHADVSAILGAID